MGSHAKADQYSNHKRRGDRYENFYWLADPHEKMIAPLVHVVIRRRAVLARGAWLTA
jgi:hypothetical protein